MLMARNAEMTAKAAEVAAAKEATAAAEAEAAEMTAGYARQRLVQAHTVYSDAHSKYESAVVECVKAGVRGPA